MLARTSAVASHPLKQALGFTLVELLVVIGIIAVMIAILLPGLQQARRSASQVKCLSALREIGVAFNQYAAEHKGAWPVAVHKFASAGPDGVLERRWQDMISKYVHRKAAQGADDISQYRRNSVLWGCPEYAKAFDFTEASYADRVRNGYGMQYYPLAPIIRSSTNPNLPGTLAYISVPDSSYGSYFKQNQWTRPSERGLIADSQTHILQVPAWSSITNWQPFALTGSTVMYVDSTRHLKPGVTKRFTVDQRGINMLFCDGHAAPVSLREAYNAIRNPGVNTTAGKAPGQP
jgi:prepilin-type N-terminal cleavage/methylation domain-containing protein/prepilin-type processing-associated H-X9-DG protein